MRTRFLFSLGSIPIALVLGACDQAPRRPVHDITIARIITGGPPERPGQTAQPLRAVTQEQPIAYAPHERPRALEPPSPARHLPLDTWRDRWPDAARELDEWADRYPDAAETIFAWDAVHDERAEALIEWAVGNRYEAFDAFLLTRHGWGPSEDRLREACDRPAVAALLVIIRSAPEAWLEVAYHPHGLAWLGSHRVPRSAEAARSKAR